MTAERVELGLAKTRRELKALGLDEFVGEQLDSRVGNVHFLCTDVDGLLARLRDMGWVFEGDRSGRWRLREPVARLSLHIRHFRGWPRDQLQAHVDLFGMIGPASRIPHLPMPRVYKHVERIRRWLDRPSASDCRSHAGEAIATLPPIRAGRMGEV